MVEDSGDSVGRSNRSGKKARRPKVIFRKGKLQNRKPTTKRTGELAEAAFLYKAAGLGFGVAKPWGDSERYDFILDSGERLWRAQVKCTEYEVDGGYPIHGDSNRGESHMPAAYTAEEIDVLIAHRVPLDIWYVVPVEAFAPRASLRFYPDGRKRAKFEHYREAWHLLRPGQAANRDSAAALSLRLSSEQTDEMAIARSPEDHVTSATPVAVSPVAASVPGVWPNVRRPIVQRDFLERLKRIELQSRRATETPIKPSEE